MGRCAGLAGSAAVAGGLLAGFTALRPGRQAPAGVRADLGIVRPPGALDEPEFLARCIRCTRCADVCEPRCIHFFGSEAGALQGTPYIMPIERGCTLCLRCGETCPTGAIEPLEKKEDAKMGLAVIDKRLCVSHANTGVCGACFTVCPFRGKAVTQEIRLAPTIHEDDCTGCGLCEQYCIVDEREGLRAVQITTERTANSEEWV